MSLIVIRLFPVGGPVSGETFRDYLDGLEIRAVDLSTRDGEAQVGDPATYVEPPDLTHPEAPDPATLIVQHVSFDLFAGTFSFQAAATAVLEVAAPNPPAGRPEHATRDLRLEITRGGGEIVQRRIYVNVPEAVGGIPADRSSFPGLEPTSLYLGLPSPGTELDPTDAYVELPADGSAPPYADLLHAVALVLGNDPGGSLDLAVLTTEQARHVAREITGNQKFHPLPVPSRPLGELYTENEDTDVQSAQAVFAGELTAHEAIGDANAERLSGYVVALATAVAAEARSTAATEAGLTFPVLPGQTGTGERFQRVGVLLTALPVATRFTVPARYFYALGAGLPATHDADQRYRAAVLADDERLRSALVASRDAGIIAETPPPAPAGLPAGQAPVADAPPVNLDQAVRRLRALGDTGGAPAELAGSGDVQALVAGWLATTAADIDTGFWDGIVGSHPSGHLDLDLAAITRGYVVPVDSVPLRSKLRSALGVANAAELAAVDTAQWQDAMTGDPTWPGNLPGWTLPGSTDERLQAFLQEVAKFFVLGPVVVAPFTADAPGAAPVLRVPAGDPVNRFVTAYLARAGGPFVFAAALFPGDARSRAWLDRVVTTHRPPACWPSTSSTSTAR